MSNRGFEERTVEEHAKEDSDPSSRKGSNTLEQAKIELKPQLLNADLGYESNSSTRREDLNYPLKKTEKVQVFVN